MRGCGAERLNRAFTRVSATLSKRGCNGRSCLLSRSTPFLFPRRTIRGAASPSLGLSFAIADGRLHHPPKRALFFRQPVPPFHPSVNTMGTQLATRDRHHRMYSLVSLYSITELLTLAVCISPLPRWWKGVQQAVHSSSEVNLIFRENGRWEMIPPFRSSYKYLYLTASTS